MPTFVAGNTATVTSSTNTTFDSTIRSANVEDLAELLDSTVVDATTVRDRIKGLEDWTITLELQFDSAAAYGNELDPGSTVTVRTTLSSGKYYEGAGIIESFKPRLQVDDVIKGELVVKCAGSALTRSLG